ncbi:hypothetical protein TNCV_256081 [Trichonephila clavipes]|nr:hypothetical protein TNCV_256081 [Trichonephila clavipes]
MYHSDATPYQSFPTVYIGLRTTIHEAFIATSAGSLAIKGASLTIYFNKFKPCFFVDPDPYKPSLVDKSLTTCTSPQTVLVSPHHLQEGPSEQSSELSVRFAELPAQYALHSGGAVYPSKRFL